MNYFNTLPLRVQLEQLGKCRFMDRSEFSDGVNKLKVKKVVPSKLVAFLFTSSTNTVMVSVVVLRFVNVNSVVEPSPLKLTIPQDNLRF